MSVGMKYGAYSLVPVPILTKSKSFDKTGAGIAVGTNYVFQLNGTLISETGGLVELISDKMRDMREAFNKDGKYFTLSCNDQILLEGYPRIIGEIQFSPTTDNWTQTIDYSLTLEFDNEPANYNISGSGENADLYPPQIRSYDESWTVAFDESVNKYSYNTSAGVDTNPYVLRLTHNLNAVGKSHYSGPGLTGSLDMPAWQQARNYVTNLLLNEVEYQHISASGVINLPTGTLGLYDHFRSAEVNETEGSYSVTETWAVLNTGHGGKPRNALEDFNVQIRTGNDQEFDSVSIDGRIQGLETRTYSPSFAISETKFAAATGYWEKIKDELFIYPRANALASSEGIALNPEPLIKVVGKDPNAGVVTYNYEFNSRPTNCISGAKNEIITIVDENPFDLFNEHIILGRPQGPILQSLNTVSSFKREVTIELLMNGNTGCAIANLVSGNNPASQVESLLCTFEQDLTSRYDYVYKSRDSSSWNPKRGRYFRTVGWTATDCDNVPPTTFCE